MSIDFEFGHAEAIMVGYLNPERPCEDRDDARVARRIPRQ